MSRIQSDILTPEAIRYLVERATQLARERLVERDLEAERARLAEVEEELENLVRMSARLGKLEAYEKVLADLEEERQALKASLAAAPPKVDPANLRDETRRASSGSFKVTARESGPASGTCFKGSASRSTQRRGRATSSGSRPTCCSSLARSPDPRKKTRRSRMTPSVSFVW